MQNHLEISSKTLFWTRNVLDWTKSRDLDMSGPAKTSPGGQVLVSKAGFCFYFFRNYTCSFFISKFIMFFWKSYVLLSKFLMLYKIICFTKQIYHFLQNRLFLEKNLLKSLTTMNCPPSGRPRCQPRLSPRWQPRRSCDPSLNRAGNLKR